MARITRAFQKIFAINATNNGQFGSAQLGTKLLTSDPATIQALAAFENGWDDAIIGAKRFPPEEEMQSLQYLNTYQIAYMFQEGIPEYDASTTYYQKSIVKKTGTYELYGSVTDNNTGNALTDATKWTLLIDLSAGFGIPYGATTNSGNDYTVPTLPTFSAFTDGMLFIVKINAANTGATRINPNSIGLTAVVLTDNTALVGGELKAGGIYLFSYNATTSKIQLLNPSLQTIPAGSMMPFAGATVPTGWLLSYGQAVNRTTYANLFSAIGTTWGIGDGSTTFNLPDMRGRTPFGKDNMGGTSANRLTATYNGGVDGSSLGNVGGEQAHVLTVAELAAHTHVTATLTANTGAGGNSNALSSPVGATTGSTGGDAAHNTVPPAAIFNMIIKT